MKHFGTILTCSRDVLTQTNKALQVIQSSRKGLGEARGCRFHGLEVELLLGCASGSSWYVMKTAVCIAETGLLECFLPWQGGKRCKGGCRSRVRHCLCQENGECGKLGQTSVYRVKISLAPRSVFNGSSNT